MRSLSSLPELVARRGARGPRQSRGVPLLRVLVLARDHRFDPPASPNLGLGGARAGAYPKYIHFHFRGGIVAPQTQSPQPCGGCWGLRGPGGSVSPPENEYVYILVASCSRGSTPCSTCSSGLAACTLRETMSSARPPPCFLV